MLTIAEFRILSNPPSDGRRHPRTNRNFLF
jgi:hypothetical protein